MRSICIPHVALVGIAMLLMSSLLTLPVRAQNSGPAPDSTALNAGSGIEKTDRLSTGIKLGAVREPEPAPHRNLFVAALATHWLGAIFDVATTHHGLAHCREGNPLFGSHPSNGRVIAPVFSFTGAYTALSLWHRRRHPDSKAPIVGNFGLGGTHIVAGMMNTRCF